MGGNIEYKSTNYGSKLIDHGSVDTHENKKRLDTEDSVHHFKGNHLFMKAFLSLRIIFDK